MQQNKVIAEMVRKSQMYMYCGGKNDRTCLVRNMQEKKGDRNEFKGFDLSNGVNRIVIF